ncbi:hypothetical protein JCM5350_004348 [Sporobolomyces pararoseus]
MYRPSNNTTKTTNKGKKRKSKEIEENQDADTSRVLKVPKPTLDEVRESLQSFQYTCLSMMNAQFTALQEQRGYPFYRPYQYTQPAVPTIQYGPPSLPHPSHAPPPSFDRPLPAPSQAPISEARVLEVVDCFKQKISAIQSEKEDLEQALNSTKAENRHLKVSLDDKEEKLEKARSRGDTYRAMFKVEEEKRIEAEKEIEGLKKKAINFCFEMGVEDAVGEKKKKDNSGTTKFGLPT